MNFSKLFSIIIATLIFISCSNNQDSITKEVISLDDSSTSKPYSPAILTGNILHVSGQIAIDPATGMMIEGGIEEQTDQVLKNLKALVEKAGFTMDDVVKCNVLLSDISHYGPMNSIYSGYFTIAPPARKAFAVKDLPLGALVEIDAIAIK
jgi:2-iminobutanoate/2-iminopropanoate deaminase